MPYHTNKNVFFLKARFPRAPSVIPFKYETLSLIKFRTYKKNKVFRAVISRTAKKK